MDNNHILICDEEKALVLSAVQNEIDHLNWAAKEMVNEHMVAETMKEIEILEEFQKRLMEIL